MDILLVDDDIEIFDLVRVSLDKYRLTYASNVYDAAKALKDHSFDLVLLDVKLPDGNGIDFCQKVSQLDDYKRTPIVLLTANRDSSNIVRGLNAGADDYITKPFLPAELRARVDARLRRGSQIDSTVKILNYEFDLETTKCMEVQGDTRVDLGLTLTEFRIFLILARNQGKIVSREDIINGIWSVDQLHVEPNVLNTHVSHLRKKIGTHSGKIAGFYNKGYSFTQLNEEPES